MELSSYIKVSNQNWQHHTSLEKKKREKHLLTVSMVPHNGSMAFVGQEKAEFFLFIIMVKPIFPDRTKSKPG